MIIMKQEEPQAVCWNCNEDPLGSYFDNCYRCGIFTFWLLCEDCRPQHSEQQLFLPCDKCHNEVTEPAIEVGR
jgi:hypothetical protein